MPSEAAISDPDLAREFAEFIADEKYVHRQQAADQFGISLKTVTKWSKDPRVLVILRELREERDDTTVRKITNELLRRINSTAEIQKMDVKTLLDIRKQILGPDLGKDDDGIDNADVVAMLEDNPDVAKALAEALTPRTNKVPQNATE